MASPLRPDIDFERVDRDRIVVAAHWLMTGSTQIEDREARVAEGEAVAPRAVGLDQQSAVIGTRWFSDSVARRSSSSSRAPMRP